MDYELKLTGDVIADNRVLNIKNVYDLICANSEIDVELISASLNINKKTATNYLKFLRDNDIVEVTERIRDSSMKVVGYNRVPLVNLIIVPLVGDFKCVECGNLSNKKSKHSKYKDLCSSCTFDKFMKPKEVQCSYCNNTIFKKDSFKKKGNLCCIDCRERLTVLNKSKKSNCSKCNKMTIVTRNKSGLCGGCLNRVKRSGYRNSKNGQFPKQIRDLFDYRCSICGYDKVVNFHHILERSEGGLDSVENCIPLCPNHHAEYHHGHLTKEYIIEIRLSMNA